MPGPFTLSETDPLWASLQALPPGVHIVLGIGMAAGIVLWLAGQRAVKPMFALIGVVLGGAIGFFLAPVLAIEPIHDIPTPYVGLGVGGLVGLTAAVALFRFTMALGACAVLALAGMMGTSVYLDYAEPVPQTDAPAVMESRPTSSDAVQDAGTAIEQTAPGDVNAWARESAERTRAFLEHAAAAGQARWEKVPGPHRMMVAGGGVCGGMLGFLFGVFVPRRASALVTALFGSALWLSCAAWTAHATAAPGLAFLDQKTQVWLVIWPVTASLGVLVQWFTIHRANKAED